MGMVILKPGFIPSGVAVMSSSVIEGSREAKNDQEVRVEKEELVRVEELVKASDTTTEVSDNEGKGEGETIESLRAKFEEKEGRPVPNNKKNDLEWIKSKI